MENTINKEKLIDKLLSYGVFKIKDKQLFELTTKDLEKELKRVQHQE